MLEIVEELRTALGDIIMEDGEGCYLCYFLWTG